MNPNNTGGGVIFIAVKEAKFFYKSEVQLDPFIRVTIGNEKHKTKTSINGGVNPKWKDTLKFKISKSQASSPERVSLLFEAYNH